MKSGSNDPLAACVRRFAKFDFGPYCMMFTVKAARASRQSTKETLAEATRSSVSRTGFSIPILAPCSTPPPPLDWEPNATVTENVLVMSV
jgi:hypothetical protein